jgi:hypothetical protein
MRCRDAEPGGELGKADNSRAVEAGRAEQVRAHLVNIVSARSLTFWISEEICGRFGSFRWIECLYVAPVGALCSDDRCQLHCFAAFVSSETEAQDR